MEKIDPDTKIKLTAARDVLKDKYLVAEHLMLKSENSDKLMAVKQQIDERYLELITLLSLIPDELVSNIEDLPNTEAWQQEKTEFDTHLKEWFDNLKHQESEVLRPARSNSSICSDTTSRATFKRQMKAKVKHNMAVLELQQTASKLADDQEMARRKAELDKQQAEAESKRQEKDDELKKWQMLREAQRKVELTEAEVRAWEQVSNPDLERTNVTLDKTGFSSHSGDTQDSPRDQRPMGDHAVNASMHESSRYVGRHKGLEIPRDIGPRSQPQIRDINIGNEKRDEANRQRYNIDAELDRRSHCPLANEFGVTNEQDVIADKRSFVHKDCGSSPGRPRTDVEDPYRGRSLVAPSHQINYDNHYVPDQGTGNAQYSRSPRRPRSTSPAIQHHHYHGSDDYLLPRPVITKYGGDPLLYWSFITNFEIHVASKVKRNDRRLIYLLQHCEEHIRKKLEHFTKKPTQGYKFARDRLYEMYGQPHVIAHACETSLHDFPALRQDKPEDIARYAELMEKCLATLEDINEFANVNTLDTMVSLIAKLPTRHQNLWPDEALRIKKETGKQAKFPHLVEFVCYRAEVSNSLYGRKLYELNRNKGTTTQIPKKTYKASSYNINADSQKIQNDKSKTVSCYCCNKPHDLESCYAFRQKSRDDRVGFISDKKLCFKCFSPGHHAGNCKSLVHCTVSGCRGTRHHTLLHRFMPKSKAEEATTLEKKPVVCTVSKSPNNSEQASDSSGIYLCVIPVNVRYGKNEVQTYAFMDPGSTATLCSDKLLKLLGVTGTTRQITLRTVGERPMRYQGISADLFVSPLDGEREFILDGVLSIDKVPASPNVMPDQRLLEQYPYLGSVNFPYVNGGTVNMLIGADHPELVCFENSCKGSLKNSPRAVKTALGWSLFGPKPVFNSSAGVHEVNSASVIREVNCIKFNDPRMQHDIDCLWKTDFGNETSILDMPTSREDRLAYDMMLDSVEHIDGHFQLPLPWRPGMPDLPNNLSMAEKRLRSLKNRLARDCDLHGRYVDVVQTYIDKGFAREIPSAEIDTSNVCWYLPHFPVTNIHKPDRVRVVFDAAAKYGNVSLNDCLLQGPDLVNNLVGVLMRFRCGLIPLVADVESMFHQISMAPKDRDALRFLWWPNGDLSKRPVPHQMMRHIFGASSSPSCATFCLKRTAHKFGEEFKPEVAEMIDDNFYVDDLLGSADSLDEGTEIVQNLPKLLDKGGFPLKKWVTNKDELLKVIPESERAKSIQNHVIDDSIHERVLGVHWNVEQDYFGFNVDIVKKPQTRRGILSMVASFFDPLGIASPVTLRSKLLLQSLCRQGLDWDQAISAEDAARWEEWLHQLPQLQDVRINRCYRPPGFGSIVQTDLHHFADASTEAYGAVSYLRLVDSENNVSVSFVIGKARLAPSSTISIPRLELTAAVLAVRLDVMLRKELKMPITSSTFWTDSTAVLQSIYNSKKRFPTFVANRLAKIDRNSDVSSWKHVPSKLNVADEASRGLTADSLINSGHWHSGPEFLQHSKDCWPKNPVAFPEPPDEFQPLIKQKPTINMVVVANEDEAMVKLINSFSSLYRLKKAAAWFIRFKNYLLQRVKSPETVIKSTSRLTVEELQQAELDVIEYIQHLSFPDLLKRLSDGGFVKKGDCSRPMLKLNPVLMDGILRVGGRLRNAPISDDAKHPIILPHSSHFTDLVIERHHNTVGHSGMGHTWTSLRGKYWIIKGGVAVRRVIGKCVSCKKRNGRPGKQYMADLPACRLQPDSPAFSHTEVDLFGPFMIKQGRSEVKRYGCVFTCMTTRAVHIEVVHSLSADSLINALRRFIGRRGTPTHIYSDNAGNFTSSEKILADALKEWNSLQVQECLRQNQIVWKHSPPTGSSHGGAWERMIRSIRRIFTAITKGQVMSDEIFVTLMVECEAALNSRPLVPVTFDPRDDEPLTPNHLLLLRSSPNLPPGVFDKKDCYTRRRWAQVQYLANQFWRRWIQEFLPNIIERQKWFQKEKNFAKDDVVLIVDDTQSRSRWAMGKIVDVYPDCHGLIRTVLVKVRNNLIKRPITKLVLIVEGSSGSDNLTVKA